MTKGKTWSVGGYQPSRPLEERFWEKVDVRDKTACWEWLGSKTSQGYGCIRMERKTEKAHRASWVLHHGAIPEGLHVLHRCDNPSCVNPNHLWLGTNYDNVQDRDQKGRYPWRPGESHPRAKLTEPQVIEIRRRADGGEGCQAIAKDYGVSRTTVGDIKYRRSWRHI